MELLGNVESKKYYEDIITMNIEKINQMTPQAIWEYEKGIKLTEEDVILALNVPQQFHNLLASTFGFKCSIKTLFFSRLFNCLLHNSTKSGSY